MSDYVDYTTGRLATGTTARATAVNTTLDAISTGLALLPTEATLKKGLINYAVDTGTANTYLVALTETATAYTDGMEVVMKAANANTGSSTIDVDSLGVKSIVTGGNVDLSAGDIEGTVTLRYNSTLGKFVLQSALISSTTAAAASATAAATSETNAATSETNAAASATAAATSETNAATSAASNNIASPTASKHGAIIYQNDADDGYDALLAQGSAGQPFLSGGADAAPTIGTLSVAGGGTGATTLTDGGVLLGSGTGAITSLGQQTDGQLIIGSTGLDPVVGTPAAGDGLDVTLGAGTFSYSVDLKADSGLVIDTAELSLDLGASAITGTLAIADGGTGSTTASTALTALNAASLAANTFTGDQAYGDNDLGGIKTATFNAQTTIATTTGAVTLDWNTAQNQKQTEPTDIITYTFTAPPGPCHLQLLIDSDGTNTAYVHVWPATVKWVGLTWVGADNKASIINFWYDGTNYWAQGANEV